MDVITLFLGDGRSVVFQYDAGLGFHIADDEFGLFWKIERDTADLVTTYTATPKFGDELRFNANGKLDLVTDTNGNTLELSYASARLVEIKDTVGRSSIFAYDAAGRLETVTDPAIRTYEFDYDHQQKLTSITLNSGGLATIDQLSVTDNEQWFMYDGDEVTADYVRTTGNDTFTLQRTYVNGQAIDSKIARIEASPSETTYFYVGDAIGSVHEVIEPSGAVVNQTLQTAWGEQLPGFTTATTLDDRYGFTQRERDEESGLMHFRARSYDPRTGRLLQKDPFKSNIFEEHYIYASNDPVSLKDPFGLQSTEYAVAAAQRHLRHIALRGTNRLHTSALIDTRLYSQQQLGEGFKEGVMKAVVHTALLEGKYDSSLRNFELLSGFTFKVK